MARKVREPKLLPPIPPGEILMEEFMKPLGISINALARDIHVPPNRVSEIVNGKRGITADTALRLSQVSWHKCRVVARPAGGFRPENRHAGELAKGRAQYSRARGLTFSLLA